MTSNLRYPPNAQKFQVGSLRSFLETKDIKNFLEGNGDRELSLVADFDLHVFNSLNLTIYSTYRSYHRGLEVGKVGEDSGAVSARSIVSEPSDLGRR